MMDKNERAEDFRAKPVKAFGQRICLDRGDITQLWTDCIVNAANQTLLGGGGVDGAIHRAAGPELLEECRTLGGCKTGEAKLTGGYRLKAAYVIHTVGPIYSGKPEDRGYLRNCYWNAMELVKKQKAESVAFPAISTGVYGYPIEEACKIALETLTKWLAENRDYCVTVILSCFNQRTYDQYKAYMERKGWDFDA